MLIRRAELHFGPVVDVRIADGRLAEIGAQLSAVGDEPVLDANGAALLPALRDHHIHLQALAAARASIVCGPPQVHDERALESALRRAALQGEGWLRGVAYHESVAGPLDRARLDRMVAARPLRIQHRTGRLWMFNSAALAALGVREEGDDPFERIDGQLTGRLYDADDWLRVHLPRERPSLAVLSRELAARGVVGFTDTSHSNGPDDLAHFAALQARGELLQELCVMGDARLDSESGAPGVWRGAHKFHLHEHALPDFEALCAMIRGSHAHGRNVAFHCVTRTELVYALGALRETGVRAGDRIEHAAVAPPDLAAQMASLQVQVVTQPNFIAERGDAYLSDVEPEDRAWLYRLRGLQAAGVALAGSSDAPYGDPDPWRAMQAACERRTPSGAPLGPDEALSPEAAFSLFSGPLQAPTQPVQLTLGAPADLCLLDAPWAVVRTRLGTARVRATWRAGRQIWAA